MRRAIVAIVVAAGVGGFATSTQAQSEKKAFSAQTSVTGGVALPAATSNEKASVKSRCTPPERAYRHLL